MSFTLYVCFELYTVMHSWSCIVLSVVHNNYPIFLFYRFTWRSEENQSLVKKLITEVQAVNNGFRACDIRGKMNECFLLYFCLSLYTVFTMQKLLTLRGRSKRQKTTRRRCERTRRVSIFQFYSGCMRVKSF